MLSTFIRRTAAAATATASSGPASTITEVRYPYFVARQSSSGRLPVYNEFRAGTKATTLIRNVDGNAGALRNDLLNSLFPLMKRKPNIQVRHGKHVEIQGSWRNVVADWLVIRGF
ncbi:hypothetical protein RSOLAG1IB_01712 [Rhizoctonia solani AG-1 IB]|uniref:Large ribosomal subunit protein mL49 n=1 Tax=Thanatephorus cucumeris (strain AG1-IB / isolate 7/3/14) TaxID=1108050 RepID=A0A0B7FDM2_THACB|nr:hypothetical protein RSOLAG1IB_01712 [Rhizoctonia solani AG-1 IB]